jgi:hypothetical protein
MNEFTIRKVDNGFIVSWWEDEGDIQHSVVFAIPEDAPDGNEADPQALMDMLYFIKENICNCYYSKHKKVNCMIRMEGENDSNRTD